MNHQAYADEPNSYSSVRAAVVIGLLSLTLGGCAFVATNQYRPMAGQSDKQLAEDHSACVAQSRSADAIAAAIIFGAPDVRGEVARRRCMVEKNYCLTSLRGSFSYWKDQVWTTEPAEPVTALCPAAATRR